MKHMTVRLSCTVHSSATARPNRGLFLRQEDRSCAVLRGLLRRSWTGRNWSSAVYRFLGKLRTEDQDQDWTV